MRFLFAAAITLPAMQKAEAHSFYTGMVNNKGYGCCGGQDCRPLLPGEFRQDQNGMWVLFEGEWLPVDDDAVLGMTSPDGRVHACIWGGGVRCLILPVSQ